MRKISYIILLLISGTLQAQIGGRQIYDFLNLTPQSRVAALGGVNITSWDRDPNMGYLNPALICDSMHNRLSLSFVDYLAGITYGYASYARHVEGVADFHAGVQYVNYGKMKETDVFGNQTGTFSASDVALVVGASRQFSYFRGGVNLKFINSNIAGFNSFTAVAMDLGTTYISKNQLFTASVVMKNLGVQLSKYSPTGQREPLPFELQAGVSIKPEHMPLRVSVTAIELQKPSLIYRDPNPEPQYDLSGQLIEPKKRIADDIFRHFVWGGEFLLSRNFHLRFGYNHLRRQELRSVNRAGLAGFSFGAGIRILKVNIDYSFSQYHAIGGMNAFTFSTLLDDWKKKK